MADRKKMQLIEDYTDFSLIFRAYHFSHLFRKLVKCYKMPSESLLFHKLTVFFDFSLTVKAAPHECVIRTGQP